jgi:hypothetical protein
VNIYLENVFEFKIKTYVEVDAIEIRNKLVELNLFAQSTLRMLLAGIASFLLSP